MSVKIGDVSGCLQIFDDGNEYLQIINEKISSIKREKEDFLKDMECGTHEQHQWNTTKTVINSIYGPTSRELLGNKLPSFLLQPPLLSNTKRITKSYTMSTSVRLG